MVEIKLGYEPKEKFEWIKLPQDFKEKNYNGKLVVHIHERLWEKVKNIMIIRKKGYDAPIIIDGKRRTGKSTLGKTIAYLLDPDLTINNFVSSLEETAEKIEKAKDDSVLFFDESSLLANSKETMYKKNIQLIKIIDVIGVKRLTLIFVLPSFFNLSKEIAINHSRFLLHVYTDEKLNRGRFAYFSEKKKKILYEMGKKNFGSYKKPESNWTGTFRNFLLPFEEDYMKLKLTSLRESLNPLQVKKEKLPTESYYKTQFMLNFKERCPNITDVILAKGFGVSKREYYRRKQAHNKVKSEWGA